MRRQVSLLFLGWALALGWLAFIHRTAPTDDDLWAQFQQDKDPRGLDVLILRGAFGTGGRPTLSEWLEENDNASRVWADRVATRHPLEALNLREEAAARRQKERR